MLDLQQVLVLVDKKRSLNSNKSKESDDAFSHRSTVSTFSKHEPINVADRFFKQVMKIGKIGAINFQTTDLEEEESEQ